MMQEQRAFVINDKDNVATALTEIKAGSVRLLGDCSGQEICAVQDIPQGHKIALQDIAPQEDVIKYGVVIGKASVPIPKGSWVHLHVMHSVYDERSGHLEVTTGAPKDTIYE